MSKFNDIYQNIYKECQEPLENSRKQTIKKAVMIFALLLILGIILSKMLENPMFIIIFLFLGILVSIASGKKSRYNAMFKEKVIKTFVREYSDQLEYKQNGGVTPSVYVQGEFESFDRYSAEDGIRGILEEYYTINMSEVHTERESRDEDGRRTYSTIFRGLFAQVEFDKFVPGTIKIRRNRNKLFGNSNSRIEMDSGEFEKIYDIYAQDKIIAMQLFTADIIQMFIDFKERNKQEECSSNNHYALAPFFSINIWMYFRIRAATIRIPHRGSTMYRSFIGILITEDRLIAVDASFQPP